MRPCTPPSGRRPSGRSAAARPGRLRELAARGSADALSDGRVSRYGRQTGDTHGGLSYSRTPTAFFHHAPGRVADVDLASCHPAILARMPVYLGRPVVLEPGHDPWPLDRAVAFLAAHADGDHAWFVKASGPIAGFANTLLPSTAGGLTNDNYRGRGRDRAARARAQAAMGHTASDWSRGRVDDRRYAALRTDEVHAGVVTWAAWRVIQALPPGGGPRPSCSTPGSWRPGRRPSSTP